MASSRQIMEVDMFTKPPKETSGNKPKPLTAMFIPGLGYCWWIHTSAFSGIIPVKGIHGIIENQDGEMVTIRYEGDRKISLRMRMEDIFAEIKRFDDEQGAVVVC